MVVSTKHRRAGAAVAAALTTLGVVAMMSGCTASPGPDDAATQVLQTVAVRLAPAGKIQAVDGTAVLMNQTTGASHSESTSYQPKEVVNDLPVRVTTRYQTKDRTGSDLSDISGYTGRVEIDVTLENLTVAPQNLTYDAAGASVTTPALVGTPLSIAASATLTNTSPSTIVFDTDSARSTNGVASPGKDGGSVVQWGTVLAPPQSDATATLRLTADVKDFAAPVFDIALRPGLHTDLSFAGVLGTTLDSGTTSDLALQQKSIDVIGRVNTVLANAGATVTDIRKNLEDTSGTLGVRATQRLKDSSQQLTAEMKSLSGQLGALQQGLSSSVTGTSSAMTAELTRIVGAMSSMLGNTTGTAPKVVDGTGCTATTNASPSDGTVYSMFQHLAALLDGYANVSDGCKTEILNELNAVIGPASPDATVCQSSSSATCALFASRTSVQGLLADLVTQGQKIVDGLNTAPAHDGLAAQAQLTSTLTLIGDAISTLSTNSKNKSRWNALLTDVHAAQAASAALGDIRPDLVAARASLDSGAGSVQQQQAHIATLVCDLSSANPGVPQAQLDAISAQITGRDCANNPAPAGMLPASGSLEQRLQAQSTVLDRTIAALDAANASSPLAGLNSALDSLESRVSQSLAAIDNNNSNGQTSAAALSSLLATATTANQTVGTNLTQIQADQQNLGQRIMQSFTDATQSANTSVGTEISGQIDSLSAQNQKTQQELSASYQSLIDSLRRSAATTLTDGKAFVDGQKAALTAKQTAATQALDASTAAAMQSIQASTSAATRDTDAAATQLANSLGNVLLDLGSPNVAGSGILGSMSTSAAKSATADFQLAEASQNAAGFANVREEDISGLLLRQAQFRAALNKSTLAPFHLDIPQGATSQTMYTFRIDGASK